MASSSGIGMHTAASLPVVIAAGMLSLAGCGGTSPFAERYAGRTVVYETGVPNFDLEVIATLESAAPGIDVVGVPCASRVSARRGEAYMATYEWAVRLFDPRTEEYVHFEKGADTVRTATYDATRRYDPVLVGSRLAAAGGEYRSTRSSIGSR